MSPGMGMFLVGLPDNAVRESQERIRSAFENSGQRMVGKKVVVNLAPADLRKEGSGFDLPIAVGILAATQQVLDTRLADTMFVGELSLDGAVKSVRGILPLAVMAKECGMRRLVVSSASAHEAAVVDGIEVLAVESLAEVAASLNGEQEIFSVVLF